MPKLYHYTSVEALSLILKNRTIKFNPLNKMDDTQEQQSSDYQNWGKLCFVSSWTDDDKESIPMWRMYCPKESGIRISLPSDPFKRYNDYSYAITHGVPTLRLKEGSTNNTTLISFKEMLDSDFVLEDIHGKNHLIQVKYSEKKEDLYPQLLIEKNGNYNLNTQKLGTTKNKHWEFQKEWRYKLVLIPISLKQALKGNVNKVLIEKFLQNNLNLNFESLYLSIKEDCFKQMEIVMSPNISLGYKVIIESLIKEYNPNAITSLYDSGLKGLII